MAKGAIPVNPLDDRYTGVVRFTAGALDDPIYRATRTLDGATVVLKAYGEDWFAFRPFVRLPPHPGVVEPLEIVARDAQRLVVTAFVRGPTLAELVARGPVPPQRAVAIIETVAGALAHLHAHGIVHAGVDPSHVIVGEPGDHVAAHLLSIDGAHLRCAQRAVPASARICRGPLSMIHYDSRYLEPEGVRGGPASAGGDVFAAGLLLFELLAGVHPFAADDFFAVMQGLLRAPTPPLPAPLDHDEALVEIVTRALAKDPDDRYPSAAALRDACAVYLRGPGAAVVTEGLPVSPFAWRCANLQPLCDPRGEAAFEATRLADGGIVWLEPLEPPARAWPGIPAHPGVPVAREIVTRGSEAWALVDAVPGDTLAALVARGAVAPPRALAIIAALADALAHLHGHGVAHHRVDPIHVIAAARGSGGPAAVLLGADAALRRAARDPQVRRPSADELRYAAPEIIAGAGAAAPADVFAAGLLLVELLTGAHPFAADDACAVIQRILLAPPLLPAPVAADAALAALVARTLAKDPAERPTAAALRDGAIAIAARLPVALGKRAALREPRRGS